MKLYGCNKRNISARNWKISTLGSRDYFNKCMNSKAKSRFRFSSEPQMKQCRCFIGTVAYEPLSVDQYALPLKQADYVPQYTIESTQTTTTTIFKDKFHFSFKTYTCIDRVSTHTFKCVSEPAHGPKWPK